MIYFNDLFVVLFKEFFFSTTVKKSEIVNRPANFRFPRLINYFPQRWIAYTMEGNEACC